MPGVCRCDLTNACAFYHTHCTRGYRAHRTPGIPCALDQEGGTNRPNLARNMRRDRGVMHGDLPSLPAPLRVAASEASKVRSRGRGRSVVWAKTAAGPIGSFAAIREPGCPCGVDIGGRQAAFTFEPGVPHSGFFLIGPRWICSSARRSLIARPMTLTCRRR